MAGAVKLILCVYDHNKNEIRNVKAHVLATDPSLSAGDEALFWYNSTDKKLKIWNGSAVKAFLVEGADHGLLGGLADDDHTQYLLVAGSRAMTGDLNMGSHKITSVTDPTSAQDAATKAYVDAMANGLDVKASVRAATTGSITLSGTQTVDGVALVAGDRVLVKDQGTGSQNGIYVVASGAWTRATDADADAEVTPGMFVFVEEGTANADSGWVLTNNGTVTVGTTALTFSQFSGAGQIAAGDGLTKTANTLNVVTASSARIVVNADNVDLATTGVSAAAYTLAKVTVDAYGRVTAAYNGTADEVAALIHAATSKTTPVDADEIPLVDSAASYGMKRLTWANLKATLKTYFDSLYAAVSHNQAETTLTFTDVTTGDVSTTKHGFAPKAPNDTSKFLRGDGAWATVPGGVSKYSTTVGDGTNATLTVTHSLGSRNVIVQVYLTASPYEEVEVGVERYDANTVKLYFASAPASGAYTVVVLG